MHFVILGLLAAVAGLIYEFARPRLEPLIPGTVGSSSNIFIKGLVTGVFILAAVWAASFALSMVGMKKGSV